MDKNQGGVESGEGGGYDWGWGKRQKTLLEQ